MNFIKRLIIAWMFSKWVFPFPGSWHPHMFGWAIGAKKYRRVG
jgi:lipopolysaccharide export LptBFGC system permease protein LptF